MNKKGGEHFLFIDSNYLTKKEMRCCGRPETGLTSTLTKTHQTHTTQNPQHLEQSEGGVTACIILYDKHFEI